jgi:hypothetical protein
MMASSFVHDFRGQNLEEAIIGYPIFTSFSYFFKYDLHEIFYSKTGVFFND